VKYENPHGRLKQIKKLRFGEYCGVGIYIFGRKSE
jgi:hypothetical protein